LFRKQFNPDRILHPFPKSKVVEVLPEKYHVTPITCAATQITSDNDFPPLGGIALPHRSAILHLLLERSRFRLLKRRSPMMQVERADSTNLSVNPMPDGSRIIRNSESETVFALNATAAAAWDACSSASSIPAVAEEMRRSFDPNVTDDLAEASLLELQDKKLVTISGSSFKATRREVLAGLGAVALPLVVSLTVGEQKAYAQHAGSVNHDSHPSPHANVPKSHKHPF
jgi:hypothetical protein